MNTAMQLVTDYPALVVFIMSISGLRLYYSGSESVFLVSLSLLLATCLAWQPAWSLMDWLSPDYAELTAGCFDHVSPTGVIPGLLLMPFVFIYGATVMTTSTLIIAAALLCGLPWVLAWRVLCSVPVIGCRLNSTFIRIRRLFDRPSELESIQMRPRRRC